MDGEYKELKINSIHLFTGLIISIISLALIIFCLIESPKEYIPLLVFAVFLLVYGLYSSLEQFNWYLRYDGNSFEVRNIMGRTNSHSFDEVKSIKPLRKGAAIIYMKGSRRQYEIEPKIEGAEEFLETFRAYCSTK